VDSSTVVFVEVDKNQVGLGSLHSQTASAKSTRVAFHFAMSEFARLRLQDRNHR
jgi:hypothetical protein